MKIRGDDPAAMKDFILSVQNTTNELKASSGDGHGKINSKRVSMLFLYGLESASSFSAHCSAPIKTNLVDGVHA